MGVVRRICIFIHYKVADGCQFVHALPVTNMLMIWMKAPYGENGDERGYKLCMVSMENMVKSGLAVIDPLDVHLYLLQGRHFGKMGVPGILISQAERIIYLKR